MAPRTRVLKRSAETAKNAVETDAKKCKRDRSSDPAAEAALPLSIVTSLGSIIALQSRAALQDALDSLNCAAEQFRTVQAPQPTPLEVLNVQRMLVGVFKAVCHDASREEGAPAAAGGSNGWSGQPDVQATWKAVEAVTNDAIVHGHLGGLCIADGLKMEKEVVAGEMGVLSGAGGVEREEEALTEARGEEACHEVGEAASISSLPLSPQPLSPSSPDLAWLNEILRSSPPFSPYLDGDSVDQVGCVHKQECGGGTNSPFTDAVGCEELDVRGGFPLPQPFPSAGSESSKSSGTTGGRASLLPVHSAAQHPPLQALRLPCILQPCLHPWPTDDEYSALLDQLSMEELAALDEPSDPWVCWPPAAETMQPPPISAAVLPARGIKEEEAASCCVSTSGSCRGMDTAATGGKEMAGDATGEELELEPGMELEYECIMGVSTNSSKEVDGLLYFLFCEPV